MVRRILCGMAIVCGLFVCGVVNAYDSTVGRTAINGNIARGESYLLFNNYTNADVTTENFTGSTTASAGSTTVSAGYIDCSYMVGAKIIRTNLTAVTGTFTQNVYVFTGTSTLATIGTRTAVLIITTNTAATSTTVIIPEYCRGIAVGVKQQDQNVAGTTTFTMGLDYAILK